MAIGHKLKERVTTQSDTISLTFEGGAWADMIITNRGHWHSFVINSDWGSWTYGWSCNLTESIFGKILSFDDSYIRRNFIGNRCNSVLNSTETVKRLKKSFKDYQKLSSSYDPEDDFIFKDEIIPEVEGSDGEGIDSLMNSLWGRSLVRSVYDQDYYGLGTDIVTKTPDRDDYFFRKIYPKFKPGLKKLLQRDINDQKNNVSQ